MTNRTRYDVDVVNWSREQAQLLRAGHFNQLDLEHLADEIEDVGKSEQRELANRMVILLAHLIKWAYQPERRGASWDITIRNQRKGILRRFNKTPSLKVDLGETEWWEDVWGDATVQAAQETGRSDFPEQCPWSVEQVLDNDWRPPSPP